MRLRPHSPEWYDRLATMQDGYYYPWGATLAPWNGEDTYLDLVHQHLRPDLDILDVACGHGEVALSIASRCRSVLGYDRIASWIERAQQTAQAQELTNATFVCHDSSSAANDGQPRLPGGEAAFDLLICRRGPFHWVEDARPTPPWNDWLPETLRLQPAVDPH